MKKNNDTKDADNPVSSPRNTINRREFLREAAGLSGSLLLSGPAVFFQGVERGRCQTPTPIRLAQMESPMWREPNLWNPDPITKVQTFHIGCVEYRIGDDKVRLRSYNGGASKPDNLTGPTIKVRPGMDLRIDLWNDLPDSASVRDCPNKKGLGPDKPNITNLHTHGLHISPNSFQFKDETYHSDNVLIHLEPKQGGNLAKFWFKIPKDHPAGTFWYHAHNHGSTAVQLANGMAGALIIDGDIDEFFNQKGVKERLWVFQQIPYVKGGDCIGRVEWSQVTGGLSITLVNGLQKPEITDLPAGKIERWRFIDGGIKEMVNFQLLKIEKGREVPQTLHLVALDGITIGDRLSVNTVEMAPGYRVDALVQLDLNEGETEAEYILRKQPLPVGEGLRGQAEQAQDLARIRVRSRETPMDMSQFSRKVFWDFRGIKEDLSGENPVHSERLVFNMNMGNPTFNINGKKFDMERIDLSLKLGRVDQWVLSAEKDELGQNKHPFHIHVNHFQIIQIGDRRFTDIPIWRDTILVRERQPVTIRMRPKDFTGRSVLHCHILDHEDRGMMMLMEIKE